MLSWELFDIANAVEGRVINDPGEEFFIHGVHHDSREVDEGSLFIPLIAERDGHDFIEEAHQAGAIASFWSKDIADAPKEIPLIIVDDTLEALKNFAQWHLKQINPKVVAVTGSNGKTTTKDMVAKVLEAEYRTHKTAGNFNNEIGLPLTLLTMPQATEIVVLEMGTDHPGEIERLSNLATPDVAIITMVGESHIEAFGTRENLAKEKMAICSGLKANGLFIYPVVEPLLADYPKDMFRLKSFALNQKADLYAINIKEEIKSTHFTVQMCDTLETVDMMIPIPGSYNVNNALIALLVGLEYGVTLQQGKQQLADLTITESRLEWVNGINGMNILNDAYNASPSSMSAVLKYFQKIETSKDKVIVLGDILELGTQTQSLHEGIADSIQLEAYQSIFLFGKNMEYLYKKLKKKDTSKKVYYFKGNQEKLVQTLKDKIKKESFVLFKSSNGTDLLSVVESLRNDSK